VIPDPEDTGVNSPDEEPTEVDAVHEEAETEHIEAEDHPATESLPPPGDYGGGAGPDDGGRRVGLITLFASIAISLILVGSYIAAGGLDYKPTATANPCDPRPWTKPGNFEESAQQFALSAVDGAACKLGVSREALTLALADEASRQQFADDHDLSDSDVEEGLRAGLDRAVDDAQDAGAIGGLAATGLHAAIKVAPMGVMINLIENAEQLFQDGGLDSITGSLGDLGGIGGIGDALDSITGGSSDSSGTTGTTGSTDSGASGIGGALDDAIPDNIKKQLDENLPQGTTRKSLENQLNDAAKGILGN
jgi:hypothetical protein